ncbi:hypothetical protein ACJ73_06249 [Blastomyces percursus]|uniref:Uncharacterized protein n=1 Tax=Blastomyces percursus TaxID=1658174 RepID=A0A1J9R2Z9_9EURO|nr:hypothetical protein ACJ73_06249 [Blastomyces percursus]
MTIKDANRQIEARRVEEIQKDWRRLNREHRAEIARQAAEAQAQRDADQESQPNKRQATLVFRNLFE